VAFNKKKKQLAAHGSPALLPRKASGRPPYLYRHQKQLLVVKLEAGARTADFPTEQWTQVRVQRVIDQEFCIGYHSKYISRLLHDLGWSA